jgi:UMF1 family MFS transporter
MIPAEATAEFYGFVAVFSTVSAIWGPFLCGLISRVADSSRPAIISVVAFFAIGFILLTRVDVEAARDSRRQWSFENA